MADNRFQGKKVSTSWDHTLTHAQRMGVHFTLDSGRRTMKEQWALFRQNMRFTGGRWVPKPGRPLTAFPSPNAPHIRVGRQAHSIDVDSLSGGESRLQRFLRKEGLNAVNDVAGESWHLTVPERQLRRYAQIVRRRQKKAGH